MRTLLRLAVAAVCWLAAWHAWPVATVAASALGAPLWAALYVRSVHARPHVNCGRCHGSRRVLDRLWRGRFGICRRCGGTDRALRLGARIGI